MLDKEEIVNCLKKIQERVAFLQKIIPHTKKVDRRTLMEELRELRFIIRLIKAGYNYDGPRTRAVLEGRCSDYGYKRDFDCYPSQPVEEDVFPRCGNETSD
jgi:hypothetical protein